MTKEDVNAVEKYLKNYISDINTGNFYNIFYNIAEYEDLNLRSTLIYEIIIESGVYKDFNLSEGQFEDICYVAYNDGLADIIRVINNILDSEKDANVNTLQRLLSDFMNPNRVVKSMEYLNKTYNINKTIGLWEVIEQELYKD